MNFRFLFDHLIRLVESTFDWLLLNRRSRHAKKPEAVFLASLPRNVGCSSLIDYLVHAFC